MKSAPSLSPQLAAALLAALAFAAVYCLLSRRPPARLADAREAFRSAARRHGVSGTAGDGDDGLECRREGRKCVLVEKETDASRRADVKCPFALSLLGVPRGAKTESGYAVTDSGRLRGLAGESDGAPPPRKCNLLLTDPLVRSSKGVSNCSHLNTRLTKIEFNKRFLSSVSENPESHTCELTFAEDTGAQDMREFLAHLDAQAKNTG